MQAPSPKPRASSPRLILILSTQLGFDLVRLPGNRGNGTSYLEGICRIGQLIGFHDNHVTRRCRFNRKGTVNQLRIVAEEGHRILLSGLST